MTFTLQFRDITRISIPDEPSFLLPPNVAKYLYEFDNNLSEEDFQSPHYTYRLLFVRKLTSKKGQADRSIEFISADSELAKTIDQEYWVLKESERKKYMRKDVIKMMNDEGYVNFNTYDHTVLSKKLDAKNPGKGYAIEILPGLWLWYDRWVEAVRQHCKENAKNYGIVNGGK